jgi:PEP-CTERM motif
MKILRHKLSMCIALATSGMFLSAARPASADLLWDWSYKCSILDTGTKCKGGSGQFTSTDTAEGPSGNPYYVLTGMTGTVEGNTITSLLPPDSLGFDNDNKISAFDGDSKGTPYSHDPSHTVTGIAFLTNNDPATAANVNLLFQNFIDSEVGDDTQIGGPNGLALENIDFSAKLVGEVDPTLPAPVPEPGSLMLFGTGILSMVGMASRRSFK